MKKYSFILAGLFFLLVSCGKNPNNDPAFAPVVNPTPKYFMTIKGFIDPSLPKNLNLQIITRYITHNLSCNYTVNSFEGVDSERIRDITLTAQPDEKGNYVVKVPIDHFLSGECEWQIQMIGFMSDLYPLQHDEPWIGFFTKNIDPSKTINEVPKTQINCYKNLSCLFVKYAQYTDDLSPYQDYTYIINYTRN